MTRLPTQSDVARLAGVSTATVSRVLNNRGVVTAAVQKRVHDAIESLHYVPHASARAMALQRTGTLGALIPTLNNAIFAEGINAFGQTAQSLGYSLILGVSEATDENHAQQVLRMIERGVDGLLLVGNDHNQRIFDRLENASVRHVCTWAHDSSARTANIGFNNAAAMHEVVDHLVALGHQRFGMLTGLTAGNDRARERVNGVVARLNHHGIALEPRRIVEVSYSVAHSRKAFWKIIDNDLTAVICGNDVIAYGACLEAGKMGLHVPENISITGFDDLDLSAELSPALTTVHVSASTMGSEAAKALIEAVENQSDVQALCLPTHLVIRQTTGPAPAG